MIRLDDSGSVFVDGKKVRLLVNCCLGLKLFDALEMSVVSLDNRHTIHIRPTSTVIVVT